MQAKIFKSGNSQAVRISKEFRLEGSSVEIFKRGDELVLKPRPSNLGEAFKLMGTVSNDFMQERRKDGPPQTREAF